ncbi:MAG: NAD-dependent epimerase/dehydratase family protein [Halobacteriales archaeon]|nr:NAD-dependent epimerase/dehydratase family protein [Halobacteriales archaeon]
MTETFDVCVTGAGGYIGSRVTKLLLDEGHDVTPVDNFRSAQVKEIDGMRVEEGDVCDREHVREAVEGSDIVTHLAAMSDVGECEENQEEAFDINVRGTENVAWVCREQETPLIFPCSMTVMGNPVELPITSDHPRSPLNHYGRTKAMSEEDIGWLAEEAFPAHVFVKSNLYGHHRIGDVSVGKRTVINIFVEKALNEEPLTVHEPGTQARDFVHVKDVARAYMYSLEDLVDAEDGARTVPIASGECMSVLELAETVRDIVEEERGYTVEIEMVENPRGTETVSEDFVVDTDEARDAIGFEAEYTVEDAVREMVR